MVYINECIDVNKALEKFLHIYELFVSDPTFSYADKPQVVSIYILSNIWIRQ